MISWICSECGCECPPSERECRVCADHSTGASNGVAQVLAREVSSSADSAEVSIQVEAALRMLSLESLPAEELLAPAALDVEATASEPAASTDHEGAPSEEPAGDLVAQEMAVVEADTSQAVVHTDPEFDNRELEPLNEAVAPESLPVAEEPTPAPVPVEAIAAEPESTVNHEIASSQMERTNDVLEEETAVVEAATSEPVIHADPDSDEGGLEPLNEVVAAESLKAQEQPEAAVAGVEAAASDFPEITDHEIAPAEPTAMNRVLAEEQGPEPLGVEAAASEPLLEAAHEIAPAQSEPVSELVAEEEALRVQAALDMLSLESLTAEEPGSEPVILDAAGPEVTAGAEPELEPAVAAQRMSAKEPEPARAEEPAPPLDPLPQLAIPQIPMPEIAVQPPRAELPPLYPDPPRKPGLPRWTITLVAAIVVTLIIASLVQKFSSSQAAPPAIAAKAHVTATRTRDAGRQPVPEPKPAPPAEPPTSVVPVPTNEYPDARFVEVTSLKIVEQNNRPQVQYLVVNNAEKELDGIALRIAVSASNAARDASPLFTVAAWVPRLAPHQSKEIRTDLDTGLSASHIPKPENLRTDVRVTSQQ